MKIKSILFLVITLTLSSCAELSQIVDAYQPKALTESEVIAGLRQALEVGTDTAVKNLSKTNGYFGNQLVKIMLPPEADIIVNNLNKLPGGSKLVDDVTLRINRAAEDAAREATPIFVNAIRKITIQDAFSILRGDKDAATQYLKRTTQAQLYELFNPKIQSSLNKPLVAGISTNQSWHQLTSGWNQVANNPIGKLSGLTPVNTSLDNYLTNKALDGLFTMISQQEASIREDPLARVSDLLKRVFGSK